jgi:hypothetical protein
MLEGKVPIAMNQIQHDKGASETMYTERIIYREG